MLYWWKSLERVCYGMFGYTQSEFDLVKSELGAKSSPVEIKCSIWLKINQLYEHFDTFSQTNRVENGPALLYWKVKMTQFRLTLYNTFAQQSAWTVNLSFAARRSSENRCKMRKIQMARELVTHLFYTRAYCHVNRYIYFYLTDCKRGYCNLT